MKQRTLVAALAVVAALAAAACGDTNLYTSGISTTPTAPGSTTTPTTGRHTIEFRATGTLTSARLDYSDPTNGITEVVSGLPYLADVFTTQGQIFLSFQVTPMAFSFAAASPFVAAQIFVDGVLFREASAADGSFNTLAVSGTWRAQ
jgi:hypothetical protein